MGYVAKTANFTAVVVLPVKRINAESETAS